MSSRTTDILCCPTNALVGFEPPLFLLLLLQGKLFSFTRDEAIPAGHIYLPSFVRSFLNVEEGEGATVRGRWDWSSGIMYVPPKSVHLTVRYARLYKDLWNDVMDSDTLSIELVNAFNGRVFRVGQYFKLYYLPYLFTVTRMEPINGAGARASPLTFGVMCRAITLESEEEERLRLKNEATVSMPEPVHSAAPSSHSLSRPASPPLLHPVDSVPPSPSHGASSAELHAHIAQLEARLRTAQQLLADKVRAYETCQICCNAFTDDVNGCRVRISQCGHAAVYARCVHKLNKEGLPCPFCRQDMWGSERTYLC